MLTTELYELTHTVCVHALIEIFRTMKMVPFENISFVFVFIFLFRALLYRFVMLFCFSISRQFFMVIGILLFHCS